MTAQANTTAAILADKKNARNAMARVEQLELVSESIIKSTNKALSQVNNRVNTVTEAVDALVQLVGSDEVNRVIVETRNTNDANAKAAAQAAIDKALADELLVKAEVVGEHSLIVFTEKDEEGKPLRWGSRVQYPYAQLVPELQAQVLGKKVGESVTPPESTHAFELTEVYTIQEPKAPVAPPEPVAAPVPPTQA